MCVRMEHRWRRSAVYQQHAFMRAHKHHASNHPADLHADHQHHAQPADGGTSLLNYIQLALKHVYWSVGGHLSDHDPDGRWFSWVDG